MSHTTALSPIVSALVKTEDILGRNRKWNTSDKDQEFFIERFFSKRDELSRYSEKELRNWISWVAAELNAVLAKEGFNIKLEDFDPDTFGVVSVLDVMVEWVVAGHVTKISNNGNLYPGVTLDRVGKVDERWTSLFDVYTADRHPSPIVNLATKSGDSLYMTIADEAASGLKLASLIDKLRSNLVSDDSGVKSVNFPMVDLNQEVDISWLLGLYTFQENTGRRAKISQAKQQTKFKMNQFGARVKSAVAAAATLECVFVPKVVTIDQPFYLWIDRPGVSTPILYAYINQDDWMDPGNLSNI